MTQYNSTMSKEMHFQEKLQEIEKLRNFFSLNQLINLLIDKSKSRRLIGRDIEREREQERMENLEKNL